ncbi:phage tail tube protein [Marinilabilia salmonicolor]|uniref:TP901-1 family phage major tail protein n=1 Tax=Marinilabilia salmonicolor TaxID=989 RepID=A0A368VDA1_9BACT|nr:phage tail tube protein [Marinilabilia salmonicolor]RCW38663.1 TP901-1 family phage major tail protein [Marinilabilia salmonicolor]
MGYINGTDLLLFHDDGAAQTPFAGSTSHSLSINNELRDAATKDSADWLEKIYGRSDWSISCDGLVSFTDTYNYEQLFDMMLAKEDIDVVFALNAAGTPDTSNTQYTGTVKIESLELTAPDNDNSTYSVTLQGSGPITKVAGI